MNTSKLSLVLSALIAASANLALAAAPAPGDCPELAGTYTHCKTAGYEGPIADTLSVSIAEKLLNGVPAYQVTLNTAEGSDTRVYVANGRALTTQIGVGSQQQKIMETDVSRCDPSEGGLIVDSVVQEGSDRASRLNSRVVMPYVGGDGQISIQYIFEDEKRVPMGATAVNCVK
jgi:hypothetical protein